MRAAQLLRTIAEAVDYAHRLGVLHLDLKPANVLLDETGTPHVADFGLARRLDQGLAAENNEVSGTPSYMAPEQATAGAQKITQATDIWGLGAVLYELVTGEPPFLASTAHGTLRLVVEGVLRNPRRYTPDLPRDLEAIILKCMARDVAQRYPSGRALADDLTRFIEGRAVSARPLNGLQRAARWTRREPKLATTALLALLALLAGLAATTQQWRRAESNRERAEAEKHIAETSADTANRLLWESRRSDALRLQTAGKAFAALPMLVANVTEQEKNNAPSAIERREIGMILEQGVALVDRMIIPDARPTLSALSPDGSLLAIGFDDVSVRWYDTATLTERGRIDLSAEPTSDNSMRAPMFARFIDNHRLLVTLEWFSYMVAPSNNDSFLIDLDTAQLAAPPKAFADFADANFAADGRYAVLFNHSGSGQVWQVDPWRPISGFFPTEWANKAANPVLIGLGARHVVHFSYSMSGLVVMDLGAHPLAHEIAELKDKRFTAWQESHDGKTLALGDEDGRVYLVDLDSRITRPLPMPAGSEVTWVAFSEDDAWFAAARHDGDAFAFDAATGDPLHSGDLRHDFDLRFIAVSHRDNFVIASGAGESVMWRMPEQGTVGGGTYATRVLANPTPSAHAGLYWAGTSMTGGLLAAADMDGEVRLWRLPRDPSIGARAGWVLTGGLQFDGAHVADVAYDQVRVATAQGSAATDWMRLPQPVLFAELVDAARTLVVVSGHVLYVFDAKTMQPRYAPIELPATPQDLTVDDVGATLLLAFGHNGEQGFEERIVTIALATGDTREIADHVSGPIRRLAFSPDSRYVLVLGPPNAETQVYDATTRMRVGAYAHDREQPVLAAEFTADSKMAWLVTRSTDESDANNATLVLWNIATNKVDETRRIAGAWPIGLTTLGRVPLLATRDVLVLNPGVSQERRSAPLHGGGEPSAILAVSRDGRLIAYARSRGVQLYDAETMAAVGPPLEVNWRTLDGIADLAFDPEGRSLLARLGRSRCWFVWPIASDARRLDALQQDAALLSPSIEGPRVLRMTSVDEHARLRARDPGGWTALNTSPTPPIVRVALQNAIPRRDPDTNPLLLDLTSAYSLGPLSMHKDTDTVLTDITDLPVGVARLDGVDFDIRGGVELRQQSTGHGSHALKSTATGISVPPVPVAAFHVLMFTALALPEPSERLYANVRLHYRDGSQALLPIRTQREVPGMTDRDRPTPIGWASIRHLMMIGEFHDQIYSNPRLPNPYPEKVVTSLDLETSNTLWAEPVFIAVTAEPVRAPTADRARPMTDGRAGADPTH
jgi:WD40 repeat protein